MYRSEVPAPSPEEAARWARVSNTANNLGREKLPWSPELWDRVDRAVHDEIRRTVVGRRFLPLVPSADALTVPADRVFEAQTPPSPQPPQSILLTVNEAAVTPVIEIWVEFALTKQQVETEATLSTAVTLATRAANLVAQGEDLLLFQGDEVTKNDDLFTTGKIQTRAGPGPFGLANTADPPGDDVAIKAIEVDFDEDTHKYGENTFAAVATAYSDLQDAGHYGPYALVLPTKAYADAHAPLKTTLIMPADRIQPLVEGRFYGTGTLPECVPFPEATPPHPRDVGVLASLGGNTLDLIFGRDATTAFVQEDNQGLYRFRVFERFALRDKDRTGRVALLFQRGRQECAQEPAEEAAQETPARARRTAGRARAAANG
jgi:uncharacterized linocin/CFP29 family protein